jgi:hypothetical protein
MLRAERMTAIRFGIASNQTAETLCEGFLPISCLKCAIALPSFDRKVFSYFRLGRFNPASQQEGVECVQ